MAFVLDTYLLAKREFSQFIRRPSRVSSTFIKPLMWLFMFGYGIRSIAGRNFLVNGVEVNYLHFILPGVMALGVLSGSVGAGMSVLRDRQAGFLKEVMVAPVSRAAILVGVALGFGARGIFQGLALLGVAVLLDLRLAGGPIAITLTLLAVVLILLITGVSIVALSVAAAWNTEDLLTYSAIASWVSLPLFMLSGIFPISRLPGWMQVLHHINPIAYSVDAIRQLLMGSELGSFPFWADLVVIGLTVTVAIAFGVRVIRQSPEAQ